MVILCGTDFSADGARAAAAAAAIAARTKRDLVLVHVLDAPEEALREHARSELADLCERLACWPVKVTTTILSGIADETLVAHAAKARAGMIVIGALGRRSNLKWTLGGTADRTAQESKVPVLVVRSTEPFERWSMESKPLSIVIAVDATAPSDAAAQWLAGFAELGPAVIIAAHVYWPPDQHERGRGGAAAKPRLPIGQGHADIDRELARELGARFAPWFGSVPFQLRVVGGLGRPAEHLVRIAEQEHADLIVVGNHQRVGLNRFWHGSVSHGVVECASTNVICVPSA